MKLQNRTALITGAAQGIGLAIAHAFVKQGGRVVLADIDADRVAAEAANIGTDNALGLALDVSDSGAVAAAIEQTVRHFGGLDIAVAGAAVMTRCRLPILNRPIGRRQSALT
jgi:NAD(P)-dependent dehydrogenase (short-subunit alcohol dehydrogenase family)